MDSKKAFQLEAQEFIFDEKDGFETMQDGEKRYGSKEDLKNGLHTLVVNNEIKDIVKTAKHSYTFIPKKDKDNDERMPIRVFLSEEDCKKNDVNNNQEYFDNLILSCKVNNKVDGIKKVVIGVGVAVVITAGVVLTGTSLGYAIEKEQSYQEQQMAPYIQQYQEQQKQEELEKLIETDRQKQADIERQMVEDTLGYSSESNYAHK